MINNNSYYDVLDDFQRYINSLNSSRKNIIFNSKSFATHLKTSKPFIVQTLTH